jgi:colicin import membrane protein
VRNGPRRTPGRLRAVIYAVLVHAAVIAALVIGFRWTQSPPGVVGKPIDAVVVEEPQKKKLEEAKRRAEEQKRQQEEARKQAEAEKKRQEEAQKLEAQRQQAEAEKQRQAELKRKQEEEAQRKQEEARRRAEEQKRQQEEARKQAEAEKQRLAEEARKREEAKRQQKAAEEQLKQQLAAEEQARVEAARAARAASEADKYKAIIRQKVSRYWNRPPGAPTGLRCTVRVRLAAGGDVLQATVIQGSGNPLFDHSVEAAVFKASPLPIPQDPDLFEYFREIEFVFNPEG